MPSLVTRVSGIILTGLFVMLSSCVTPVTAKHWKTCEELCKDKGGAIEACVEVFAGPGCHCATDEVIWIDKSQT